jgi:hypothetical protein
MNSGLRASAFFLFLFFSVQLSASLEDYYPYQLTPTSSNYGFTGLLEMPSGRFMEAGSLKFGLSSSYPNAYTFIVASPFPWFEAGYRYSEIKTEKYGPVSYSGNQTFKDKGFDIKIRVLEESFYLPNVAIGLRDMAGSGKFSGEYIVGSKRFGFLDVSMGIGWGLLAAEGSIRNPLISFDERFEIRDSMNTAEGGNFKLGNWFSGKRSSLFGGLEYSFPKRGFNLKLEYDTSNPDMGLLATTPVEVKSRFNVGLTRPLSNFIDLGLSFERGTQVRFSFVIKGSYGQKGLVPKLETPKNVIPLSPEQKKQVTLNKGILYRSLNKGLREESIYIQGATYSGNKLDIAISQAKYRSYPRAVGRTARIASALSPDDVENINVFLMNGDIEFGSISLDRKEFDKANNAKSSNSELLYKSSLNTVGGDPQYKQTDFKPTINYPQYLWNMSPALKHQIGGPEAFYLGQLWWKITSSIALRRGLSFDTVVGIDLYNNFNEFNNRSSSQLPHVRSDIQEYLLEGKNNIARMKLSYIWSPYKNWFAKLEGGLLEEMFGGYGGEVYYRPFKSDFSLGLTMHKVKQRGFKQRFKFRDYETETGHLGLYYDLPQDVHAQLLIGKYLAGDKGATLDLSRRFKTGFTLGIFATKTNLSAAEFGEGSFDKGFYFAIPTDLFYPTYEPGFISFGLHPLTKDGGAMLNHQTTLFSLFADTTKSALERDWGDILD